MLEPSHWVHEISLPKRLCHHFWHGLTVLAKNTPPIENNKLAFFTPSLAFLYWLCPEGRREFFCLHLLWAKDATAVEGLGFRVNLNPKP
jgi:hypothetical protein